MQARQKVQGGDENLVSPIGEVVDDVAQVPILILLFFENFDPHILQGCNTIARQSPGSIREEGHGGYGVVTTTTQPLTGMAIPSL